MEEVEEYKRLIHEFIIKNKSKYKNDIVTLSENDEWNRLWDEEV